MTMSYGSLVDDLRPSDEAYRFARDTMDLPSLSVHGPPKQIMHRFIEARMAPVRQQYARERQVGAQNVFSRFGPGVQTGQYGRVETAAATGALQRAAGVYSEADQYKTSMMTRAQELWLNVLADKDEREFQMEMFRRQMEARDPNWLSTALSAAAIFV